jgi:methyl-accepting chemotaxis protein
MIKDEIGKAISAHGQWKQKLRVAIDTGASEAKPEKVKQDSNCAFGKWLHQAIAAENKKSPFYAEVIALHASFHKEAGAILELAVAGNKDAANDRMKLGGEFAKISGTLTKKLQEWRSAV